MIYNIGQRPINKSLRLLKTAGSFEALSQNCEHKLLVSSCLSVCWHKTFSAFVGPSFLKFDTWVFFETDGKIEVSLKSDKNNRYFS